MRICFDLDGTLCDGDRPGEDGTDYSRCQPLFGAAGVLRNLRKQGHTVIIQTARGMGRSNNSSSYANRAYVDDKGLSALAFWDNHWEERHWQ